MNEVGFSNTCIINILVNLTVTFLTYQFLGSIEIITITHCRPVNCNRRLTTNSVKNYGDIIKGDFAPVLFRKTFCASERLIIC